MGNGFVVIRNVDNMDVSDERHWLIDNKKGLYYLDNFDKLIKVDKSDYHVMFYIGNK